MIVIFDMRIQSLLFYPILFIMQSTLFLFLKEWVEKLSRGQAISNYITRLSELTQLAFMSLNKTFQLLWQCHKMTDTEFSVEIPSDSLTPTLAGFNIISCRCHADIATTPPYFSDFGCRSHCMTFWCIYLKLSVSPYREQSNGKTYWPNLDSEIPLFEYIAKNTSFALLLLETVTTPNNHWSWRPLLLLFSPNRFIRMLCAEMVTLTVYIVNGSWLRLHSRLKHA